MLVRSRSRNRARGGGSSLSNALLMLASYGATDAWDFVADQYIRAGVVGPSGLTFTRASVGSYLNNNNTMTVFSSGQPRIGDKGILIEGSRQNLFLNSAVGATQSITVTAAAHTLSFFGTGTVTLSGVSTDGPLVGTGEFNRVSLTFTPTAGSLTLTVSGDIKWVNLELGSFPTSWIPSDGTAVTRAADVAETPIASAPYPASIYCDFSVNAISGGTQVFFRLDTGAEQNEVYVWINNASSVRMLTETANVTQANVQQDATVAINTPYRAAGRIQTNNFILARNGNLGAADTSGTLPASSTRAVFGNRFGSSNFAEGYILRAAFIPSALTDAQLQGITT